MTREGDIEPAVCAAIAFVGDALAPFYLEDPGKGSAGPTYEAFSQLDAASAAAEWLFGEREAVKCGFEQLVSGLTSGVTDELVWEYRRLFVGPGHKVVAPWGSVYTDHEGVVFGETALALRAWMRGNGIRRLADEGDPDDHIGLLLALMAWISRNRPELLREFMREHLLTWAPHYLEKLEREAKHSFFAGIATLTAATLEGVRETLGITVQQPRFYR